MELAVTGIANGGEGVARAPDGRAVFVRGGIPGDTVAVRVEETKPRFLRASVLEVLAPGPGRVDPPCPEVAAGCGGCDLQHVDATTQVELKRRMVADALERIGGIAADVEVGPSVAATAHRTSVRCGVEDGRAGFRYRSSREVHPVDRCLVAHPLVEEMMAEGRFVDAAEVTLRAGARTGERLALVAPTAAGVELPDDVLVVGRDELRRGRRAWFTEEAAGRRWRVSAASFFQSSPEAAEALVSVVGGAVAEAEDGPLVDLYSGIGLFAGTVAGERSVVAVEQNRSSVADARANLGDGDVRIIRSSVEKWSPSRAAVVVADPARKGLGRTVVTRIGRTGAARVVLVSCDAGSLGRDAGLLGSEGFDLARCTLVDVFPHTSHVEVVSVFEAR